MNRSRCYQASAPDFYTESLNICGNGGKGYRYIHMTLDDGITDYLRERGERLEKHAHAA